MSEGLSYFEYTTLLALIVFEDLDLIVLEAGLGGEYDATNVCDKDFKYHHAYRHRPSGFFR